MMHARNSFENKIFWKRIIKKTFRKLTWFFPLSSVPSPFLLAVLSKKGLELSYQSLFMLQNMFRKIPYLVIYHVRNFDDLMQSGFQVIPKITFLNLCKPVKDVIIIPVLSVFWISKLGMKGKNYKNLSI